MLRQIFPYYFKRLIGLIVSLMSDLQRTGVSVEPKVGQCSSTNTTPTSNITAETFNKILMTVSVVEIYKYISV